MGTHMHCTAICCHRRRACNLSTHILRPIGERLQPHAAVYNFDCTACGKRCSPEPRQGVCARCISSSQARAGQVTTLLEPFLDMMLQRSVARVGGLPVSCLQGYAAPVDRRMFFAMHKMLVAQLPQPGAGQGISMCKLGNPVQVGTTILKYTFDLTLVEVVAEAVQDRSWSVRVLAPLMPGGPMPIASRVTEGPVFHHANGAIGCIATPLTFTWEANAPYHGVKADRAQVKHAYFILDTGGVWSGMGRTKNRTSEMAIYNRVSCVKHANKLRARGAVFSAQQNAVLDAMTLALVQTMADVESEEEDEAGVEDEMMSPGRAAQQA